MSRSTTRTIHQAYSWRLAETPIRVRLRLLSDRSTRLVLSATTGVGAGFRGGLPLPNMYTGLHLNKVQGDAFFIALGKALGYEMPKSSAKLENIEIMIRDRGRGHGIRGRKRKRGILIRVYFGGWPGRLGTASGRIQATLTKRKAHAIFKEMAKPLGWELYEKEV